MLRHTKTFMTITFEIWDKNNKVNVDFTETKDTFSLNVAFERPF